MPSPNCFCFGVGVNGKNATEFYEMDIYTLNRAIYWASAFATAAFAVKMVCKIAGPFL